MKVNHKCPNCKNPFDIVLEGSVYCAHGDCEIQELNDGAQAFDLSEAVELLNKTFKELEKNF